MHSDVDSAQRIKAQGSRVAADSGRSEDIERDVGEETRHEIAFGDTSVRVRNRMVGTVEGLVDCRGESLCFESFEVVHLLGKRIIPGKWRRSS